MAGDLVNSVRDLEKKVENLSRELSRLWGPCTQNQMTKPKTTKTKQAEHRGFTARSKLSAGQGPKPAETESAEWKE